MKHLLLLLFAGFVTVYAFGQAEVELNTGWKCKKATDISAAPAAISMVNYSLTDWMPATVPGTVLTTLLNNKLIPDPFYGMNNLHIPDLNNVGAAYYTYWFCKDFSVKKDRSSQQIWIHFRGINYSADIYLNGKKVNATKQEGMFLRTRYDITGLVNANGNNRLAVIVYPPAIAGNANGGQGGDGEIARNVMHQYVAGWDWIQPIRDRNTGIWDKVTIEKTGAVSVLHPHIITKVPGIRLPDGVQAPAEILVSTILENNSSATVAGNVQFTMNGQNVHKAVSLLPHTKKEITLPSLTIFQPKLWWPNTYGAHPLYPAKVTFEQNGIVSDEKKMNVGIREIRHEWNARTRSMQVSVNGQPIFIKGGNWIISDAMLRFSPERYDAEVRFHRDMNLNLIRIWGGAIPERPEFYDACDKYGMLVMQDFLGSGDCNGKWLDPMKKEDQWTRRTYPDNHALYIASAQDEIQMLRNHASLAIWCGGNEISLPQDILHILKDSLIAKLDGTRWFIDYSNSDSMSYNSIGNNGDGPYDLQDPKTFWTYRTWPFNSEVGSVGVGDMESLKRFLPLENQVAPDEISNEVVADSVWNYHKYIGYKGATNAYGASKNLEDFSRKAQLVNYEQYRALAEGFTAHQWDWYTGFIIWKTQNPWTALRGQMYDYYLDPNACLYGLRKGGEPIHISWNPADSTVFIINNTFATQRDLMLVAKLYAADGKENLLTQVFTEVTPVNSKKIMSVAGYLKANAKGKYPFLVLQIKDADQNVVSENVYWLADQNGKYSYLENMQNPHLETVVHHASNGKLILTLTNAKGNAVSFFNRISLVDKTTGKRVLPTFYSDNYVTILPGAAQKIMLESNQTANLAIEIESWNGKKEILPID